jgi:hypothetical protein
MDEIRDLAIIKVIGKAISFKDIRKYFHIFVPAIGIEARSR